MARSLIVSGSDPVLIFDSAKNGGPCSEFFVGCNPDSGNGCDVYVVGLHQPGDSFPLYPDSGFTFKSHNKAIMQVYVTPNGGDTVIDSGVLAR